MTKKIDFDKYALFVDGVTSDSSKDYQCFIESISSLDGKGANIERLLTAAVGISAEGGDLTLEQIETLVKFSLDVSDTPLKTDAFDDFMSIIIEGLNDRKKTKES